MGRRRNDPFKPLPKGRTVTGRGKQLELLDALQTYEVLPTSYLHHLLGYQYGRDLIRLLNGEGYIRIPEGAGRILDARTREACWELTDKGRLLLASHERFRHEPRGDDQFSHKYLRSIIQFSFDQAPREIPNLKKRAVVDILAHPNCPPALVKEAQEGNNVSYIPLKDTYVKPDAPLFGFEYAKPDGKKRTLYLHGFEADRGTQPLTGFDRQTIQRKVKHYCEYLKGPRPLFNTRYGLMNCLIAFVCVDAHRAASILDVIEREAKDLSHKFIVKVTKPFESRSPVPPPDGHMVTQDWMQAGGKTFNIMDVLKGPADGRTGEGKAHSRAA